jgi:hypothetical protein
MEMKKTDLNTTNDQKKYIMKLGSSLNLPSTDKECEEFERIFLNGTTVTCYDQIISDIKNTDEIAKIIENGKLKTIIANKKIILKLGQFNTYCSGITIAEEICKILEEISKFTEEIEIESSEVLSCIPSLVCFENVEKITFSPQDNLYPENTDFVTTYLEELKNVKEVVFTNMYPSFKNIKSDIQYSNIEFMTISCDDKRIRCNFEFHRFPNLKKLTISDFAITDTDRDYLNSKKISIEEIRRDKNGRY